MDLSAAHGWITLPAIRWITLVAITWITLTAIGWITLAGCQWISLGRLVTDIAELGRIIDQALERTFGWKIDVIIRTHEEVRKLVEANPFVDVNMTSATRLYVTYRGDRNAGQQDEFKAPYRSPEGDVQISRVSDGEICSSISLSPGRGTVDLMSLIEKEFGKSITTRNWNTLVKIAAL